MIALAADGEWTVALIKNRLMEEFDASETGGYRDVLVNVLSARTAQFAEVQVTAACCSAKHWRPRAYQLTRILDLNSKEHMEHKGELGDVLARIEFGMIQLERGQAAGWASTRLAARRAEAPALVAAADQRRGLARGGRSPTCSRRARSRSSRRASPRSRAAATRTSRE